MLALTPSHLVSLDGFEGSMPHGPLADWPGPLCVMLGLDAGAADRTERSAVRAKIGQDSYVLSFEPPPEGLIDILVILADVMSTSRLIGKPPSPLLCLGGPADPVLIDHLIRCAGDPWAIEIEPQVANSADTAAGPMFGIKALLLGIGFTRHRQFQGHLARLSERIGPTSTGTGDSVGIIADALADLRDTLKQRMAV